MQLSIFTKIRIILPPKRQTSYLGLISLMLLLTLGGCKSSNPATESLSPATSSTEASSEPQWSRPPALLVKANGDTVSRPIALETLHLHIRAHGSLATTTVEMVFYNPHEQELEGQFFFPLAEGQFLSRFALEVNGRLREAVSVEKQQARVAYESVVRQKIDPGLVEWTQGNVFKTRIYPIPPKGTKRLVLAYDQELEALPHAWRYLLPLAFSDTVAHFSLTAEVEEEDGLPQWEKDPLGILTFEAWETAFRSRHQRSSYVPNRAFSFLIPRQGQKAKSWVEQGPDGSKYWYARLFPPVKSRERKLSDEVSLLWDVSHSARNRDLKKEYALLESLIQEMGSGRIHLTTFDLAIRGQKTFYLQEGKSAELMDFLRAQSLDGATAYEMLDFTQLKGGEIWLFSDGLSTIGQAETAEPLVPLMSVVSSSQADIPHLRRLSMSSAGKLVNLQQLSVPEALAAFTEERLQFLGVLRSDEEAAEVYPYYAQEVGTAFSISGQLLEPEANLTVLFGFGNQITYKEPIRIRKKVFGKDLPLIARRWAMQKLTHLSMDREKNRLAITQLGRQFGLATSYTSLLVLDRVQDYVTHGIEPPEPLKKEYQQLVQQIQQDEQADYKAHMETVVSGYKKRVEWWNQTFKIPRKPYIQDDIRKSGELTEASTISSYESIDDDWGESQGGLFLDNDPGDASMDDFEGDQESIMDQKAKEDEPTSSSGTISINPWQPDVPYLKKLKAAKSDQLYRLYLSEKKAYLSQPSFFLDVADFFWKQGRHEEALRILSNLAEMELKNHELLRVLGRKLIEWKKLALAESVLEEVLEIRPEEPQSYRDLGLLKAEKEDFQGAVNMLYEVVSQSWNDRFPEISVLATHELNNLIARSPQALDIRQIDRRLIKAMPTDIRVVLDWDTDAVDMDLWVTDPRGEKCYYSHSETEIGGWMSRDFTGGYGPEEFLLKKAMPGTYKVEVNYYGSSQVRLAGPTHLTAKLITGYGTASEKIEQITLRLADAKDVYMVGELSFP